MAINFSSKSVSSLAVDSSRASSAQPGYRPELDALRFLAFLMVFCHHSGFQHGWLAVMTAVGTLGVPVFFALSAFLIVSNLLHELDKSGTVYVGFFAMRRILRIWPLYFVLLGYGLVAHVFPPGQSHVAALELSFMLGNLFAIHHGWGAMGSLGALWSLSVEEQFYLVVPWIVRFGGRRLVWAMFFVTPVISYLVLLHLGRIGASHNLVVWANSFVQFQFFAAGGVVALLLFGRRLQIPMPVRALIAAVGLGCYYHAIMRDQMHWDVFMPTWHLVVGYLYVLIGTCLLLLAFLDIPIRFPRLVLYLGKISYGLYMLHLPILWWILFGGDWRSPIWQHLHAHHNQSAAVALILTVLLASISYKFLEKPFLRLKRRFEPFTTRSL